MSLEFEIRERICQYLTGNLSLQDFHSWFVVETWDHFGEDAILDEVAGTVELVIAEYTSGHRSIEELREGLKPLVTNYKTNIVFRQGVDAGS